MLDMNRILKSNRQMLALTGMSISEYELLLPEFSKRIYLAVKSKKNRLRKIGGGRKGSLKSIDLKLFFILFYLKVYPTYDLASAIFSSDRSRICRWVKSLLPLLEETLGVHCVLPKRKIRSLAELFDTFPNTQDLFIDATERHINRPSNSKKQRNTYSGKKKLHTRKNTIIGNSNKQVLYVSPTKNGRIHDFTQAKKEQIFDQVPDDICLWVDKGYQGIKNIVDDNQVQIPHKKPKGNPLTSEQKEENKIISGIRVVIEHTIGGIKRFGCMSHKYRNRKGQDDKMIALCAGLWNFHIQNN